MCVKISNPLSKMTQFSRLKQRLHPPTRMVGMLAAFS